MTQTTRIAVVIRYDGHCYHGWQRQEGIPTIQTAVEQALSAVANHPISVTCAGRTDAGVHATAQVIHFDTTAIREMHAWVFGANSHLPPDIRLISATVVDHDFHARFSATARRYRYVLYNHHIRPGILHHAVGWCHRPLSLERMQMAAKCLLGEHDFSSFRASSCQAKNAIRTMHHFTIFRQGDLFVFDIKANAFLHHMVRNLVGSLITVGLGERSEDWMAEILFAQDRREAGVTFTPNGLYLVEVDYPNHFNLPKAPVGPFFLVD